MPQIFPIYWILIIWFVSGLFICSVVCIYYNDVNTNNPSSDCPYHPLSNSSFFNNDM